MAIFNSNQDNLTVDGVQIGRTTNASLSFQYDMLEVTRKRTGGFMEVTPGRRGATISFDGLVDWAEGTYFRIADNIREGTRVTFRIGSNPGQEYTGRGYVENINLNSATDSAVTYSGTIIVTGPLNPIPQTEDDPLCIKGQAITIKGDTLIVAIQV